MASELRVNYIKNRSGLGTVTFADEGLIIAGITSINLGNSNLIVGSGTSTGTANQVLQANGGAYVSGDVGIGTTNPITKLHVVGTGNTTLLVEGNARVTGILTVGTASVTIDGENTQINVGAATTIHTSGFRIGSSDLHSTGLSATNINATGVVTATTFVGALTGTATTATALQNSRTFEITGDIVASPISFDGTGNVSLAATIQPNSVALGTDTTGDYVTNITGTSNQITVTSGTGEGSTPTLSVPNQFTAPQDVTVTRDLQVNRNLNVNGNITIGGTSAFIAATELKIYDPDIVLGVRTDGSGNDISTDNTANHGGIAIASTEGSPLVSLYDVGVGETNPATYKKFMWFKSGTFSGLGTDAWLSNYAVGIGSTQFPTGTRLAAGNIQLSANDINVVRNINSSGVVTATTFSGSGASLTGVPVSTGISGLGANVATFLATPSSANLAAAVTDETGSGALVFANTPTLTTPNIGAATGTSLSVSSDISLGGELNFGGTPGGKIIDFYTKNSGGSLFNATFRLVNHDSSSFHTALVMNRESSVDLYNNNNLKFATQSDGVLVQSSGSYWTGIGLRNNYPSASLEGGFYLDFRNESGIPKGSIHNIYFTGGGSELRFATTASGVARGTDSRTTRLTIAQDGVSTFNGKVHISREGASECCSSGNYTLSLAENTGGSGTLARIQFHNAGVSEGYIALAGSGSRRMYFGDNQAVTMGIECTGSITAAGNVSGYSDIRLKENIETISNALYKVTQLRGVEFDRKDLPNKPHQIGVIAQEIEKVIPEVVHEEEGVKSVSYGNLVGLLIEAIKDLKEEVNELKAKLEEK